MSKQVVEASMRDIELAMRNARPRSYYVCRAEDLTQLTSFAHRLRIFDLQLITEDVYVSLASNPAMKLQFPVCFDPATKTGKAADRFLSASVTIEEAPQLPSPHPAVEDTANPGGSA